MVNIGIDIPYMDHVGDGRDISMVGLGKRFIQKKRIGKKKNDKNQPILCIDLEAK